MDFETQCALIVSTDRLHRLAEKPLTSENLHALRQQVLDVAAKLDGADTYLEDQ